MADEIKSFLATVNKVFIDSEQFQDLNVEDDYILSYNDNKNFQDKNTEWLGAIQFRRDRSIKKSNYAFPFDKNNIVFPIVGETVIIIDINDKLFWLPYSNTLYPNYREDYITSEKAKERDIAGIDSNPKNSQYKENMETGTPNKTKTATDAEKNQYPINEKIKFLQPREGDRIIMGRGGNTIRFSEFFLSKDNQTPSPSIFIRNHQNPELDDLDIGNLIDEDINKDGTSIYITSNEVEIPYNHSLIEKDKIAFTDYPNSENLTGNQLFMVSDRILISSKASEMIFFSKGNAGLITDGNYSIDAAQNIYFNSDSNITIHSNGNNQIFLNPENGEIFLGKNQGKGDAGADVQKMVLGGETVKVFEDLIDAILKQTFLTPSGTTKQGPENAASFQSIKNKLKNILSSNIYLSK